MNGQLRVSAVQVSVRQNDIDANMKNVENIATQISQNEKNVDLILFHEVCLESGTSLRKLDEALCSRITAFWKEIADRTGSNILAGRLERKNGAVYNKATVFAPGGNLLADYAKIHLYNGEREVFEAGRELAMFEINGMKIGIMICADFGFPELSRTYAVNGCHVLAVSSSWAYPDDDLWVICNQARAAENGVYVVSCNRTGPEADGVIKVGRSMVCDPNGTILENLEERSNSYYVRTIYRSEVERRHQTLKWHEWLRPGLYAEWMNTSWPDSEHTNGK